jgi:ABC-type sugar transport system, periplasmic component
MLANITSDVNSWSNKPNVVSGMLANDTQSGTIYAVPWFGGVRGIWYRTDQFKAAGISTPPASWSELVTDAKKLMAKNPGTYGWARRPMTRRPWPASSGARAARSP